MRKQGLEHLPAGLTKSWWTVALSRWVYQEGKLSPYSKCIADAYHVPGMGDITVDMMLSLPSTSCSPAERLANRSLRFRPIETAKSGDPLILVPLNYNTLLLHPHLVTVMSLSSYFFSSIRDLGVLLMDFYSIPIPAFHVATHPHPHLSGSNVVISNEPLFYFPFVCHLLTGHTLDLVNRKEYMICLPNDSGANGLATVSCQMT